MAESIQQTAPSLLDSAFSDKAFNELMQAATGEPAWLLDRRRAAFDSFKKLGLPKWNYSDPSAISLIDLDPFLTGDRAAALQQAPAEIQAIVAGERKAAGLVIQANSQVVHIQLDESLKNSGVILVDMATALREHGDLIQKYFLSQGPSPSEDKFLALHTAFWQGGFFLYVPKNLEVEEPFYYYQSLDSSKAAVLPHNLIVTEQGAVASVFEEQVSVAYDDDTRPYCGAYTEMYLNDGSQLNYYLVERWGTDVNEVSQRRAFVGRDARLLATTAYFGGGLLNTRVQADLVGSGAQSELLGLALTAGRQHLDIVTTSRHVAPHTTGEMAAKRVLRDESRVAYQGLIVIENSAPHSQDYLQENALILDDGARADSIPSLIIQNDEVAATHGATIGKISETQLFYLMSRGISRREAQLLIVTGFFQPLLERVPGEDTQERLAKLVMEKVTA